MVIVTAGGLAVAALLAPPATSSPNRALAFLLFVGASSHVASTGWLFTIRRVRAHAASRPVRYVVVPVALVLTSAMVAAMLTPSQLSWLLLGFFAWQFHHFQKQNLGMVAIVGSAYRLGPFRRSERRLVIVAGGAGITGLMCHPQLLQLRTHAALDGLFALAAGLFMASCLVGLALLLKRPPSDRPPSFCAAYVVALLFFLPVFLFSSPYAAVGGMTIAHGLQYLLLVGLVAGHGDPKGRRMLGLAVFCNVALVGGLALSAASHLHSGPAAVRLVFGVYLGVVMAHFVVDADLWRLRDPFSRAFLSERLPFLVRPRAETGSPFTDRSVADI